MRPTNSISAKNKATSPLTTDELSCLESLLSFASGPELERIERLLANPMPMASGQGPGQEQSSTFQPSKPRQPETPLDLAKLTWGEQLLTPPHLQLLNSKLVQVATGDIRRLLITMPPRHGKSMLTSEHFPAWYLGTFPDRQVILASYEAEFASHWGGLARNVLEEYGHVFGVTVNSGTSAKNNWGIAGRRGLMKTAGVGGAITGKGAHLLIIDDPVKNAEEANSYVMRQKTWEFYQSTARTRLEPGGSVVVIQTRWHGDDLAGRLITQSRRHSQQWEIFNLPAIAGQDDPIGRKPGDALWPERYNEQELRAIREDVGEYVWAALYQQRPQSDEGGKIKREWLRYWNPHGDFYRCCNPDGSTRHQFLFHECTRITTIDAAGSSAEITAEKKGKPHSYSVISTFDFHRETGSLVWIDVRRGRWDINELQRHTRAVHAELNPAWIGVEPASNGAALLQLCRDLSMRPLPAEGKDKVTRAARALNDFEQGRIYIARDARWRDDLEAELLAWEGTSDEQADQIDTLAYACNHVPRQATSRRGSVGPILVGRV